jgi:hypothetical protein
VRSNMPGCRPRVLMILLLLTLPYLVLLGDAPGRSSLGLLAESPLAAEEPPSRADFHVATTGSDDNPGTADKPFATLARARDAVRRLRSGGPPKANVKVLVRGGTYVLT